MPSIHRFLLKTLCVFGVTFTLTLPHNTAWGSEWCKCEGKNNCQILDLTYTTACPTTYCFEDDQLWCDDFLRGNGYDPSEYTCEFKCTDPDAYCGCKESWTASAISKEIDDTLDEWAKCYGHIFCYGDRTKNSTYGIESADDGKTCGINYIKNYASCASTMYDYIDLKCNTKDKYYYVGEQLSYKATAIKIGGGDCPEQHSVKYYDCKGCSTTKCNDETPEWKNCGNTGMDCFDTTSVTLCAPGEADGTNGCYDPNLYERQVGYTFNASANDGNGSCTWQIKNEEWRCKAGYYPTTIQPKSSVDLQREPNFRCTPCPVGYVGAEYNDKTQTWSHDISFDNDLLVAPTNFYINSCKKCPAGQSTFLSDADAPLLYFEGADDICYPCPDGYFNDGTQNISLTVYEINGSPITPTTKSGNGCELCPQGTYSTSGATACDNCPAAFTTVLPLESDLTTHNDSIQMCYIDPNVMLSDSLGKIKLSEEIGSGTKLYHQ